MTGCGRKLASCGRKKASDSNEGRKIAIFPYPPYINTTHPILIFYMRLYIPLCVRKGKKIDRDREFASAICVHFASAPDASCVRNQGLGV